MEPLQFVVYMDDPVAAYVGDEYSESNILDILAQGIAVFAAAINNPNAYEILRNNISKEFILYNNIQKKGLTDKYFKINPVESYAHHHTYSLQMTIQDQFATLCGKVGFIGDYDKAFRQYIGLTLKMFEDLAEEQDMAFEVDTFLEGYLKMCAIVLDKSDNSF